jgi:hypothetical protein
MNPVLSAVWTKLEGMVRGVMEPQGVGGEGMLGEHTLNPMAINGIVLAVSDDPCPFPSGEGGSGQAHDGLSNASGQEELHCGLPPGVTQCAPIRETIRGHSTSRVRSC